MSNTTIKDIARELGIHHATVSRALREDIRVKKETRELVWKKANELGYRPNRLAQEFRNKRSNTIGMLVPDIQHHFFSKFISDFSKEAHDSGFSVMVFQSDGKLRVEKEIIDSLVGYRIAGLVASVSKETTSDAHFDLLKNAGIPCVFFDRVPEDSGASKVVLDNFQAAYDAVKLLINAGRKRIAFITTPDPINVFNDRLLGYRKALDDYNLPFDEQLIMREGLLMEDGLSAGQKLLALPERPDAVFAIRDELAIGVIKFLKKSKINIPGDIAIVGFDNDPMGIACEPELTTVDQRIHKMASVSFDLLLRHINSNIKEPECKILKAEIIHRGSS
jgi:LacI family transcriptional regulator